MTPRIKLHTNMSLSITFDEFAFISDYFEDTLEVFKEILILKLVPSRDLEFQSLGMFDDQETIIHSRFL